MAQKKHDHSRNLLPLCNSWRPSTPSWWTKPNLPGIVLGIERNGPNTPPKAWTGHLPVALIPRHVLTLPDGDFVYLTFWERSCEWQLYLDNDHGTNQDVLMKWEHVGTTVLRNTTRPFNMPNTNKLQIFKHLIRNNKTTTLHTQKHLSNSNPRPATFHSSWSQSQSLLVLHCHSYPTRPATPQRNRSGWTSLL